VTFTHWASVPIHDYRQLPAASGVYACLNADANPLYIGQAKNLRARWRAHDRAIDVMCAGCVCVAYLPTEAEALNEVEDALVVEHQPPLNKRLDNYKIRQLHRQMAPFIRQGRAAVEQEQGLAQG
jgi:excinuclease UvrABC nuclease subunit